MHDVDFHQQVLAATFDGASVNRHLVKIHGSDATFVHKVTNVYAPDERDLFFSDTPHLIKTVRNCWASKNRSLWVRLKVHLYVAYPNMLFLNPQCNGSPILWDHLQALYETDSGRGSGLALVPKLKFEHIFKLTSFAKMWVDLAAQVSST